MPQSLSLVIIHLIFGTKDRHPAITSTVKPALHAYVSDMAKKTGCECYRVGGMADHLHLALRLPPTLTLAALVEELKVASSKWIKSQDGVMPCFAWQRGYACFSVGPKDLDALVQYIDTQAEHHRNRTFLEEVRTFLDRYGVAYDEAYLWD